MSYFLSILHVFSTPKRDVIYGFVFAKSRLVSQSIEIIKVKAHLLCHRRVRHRFKIHKY